MIIVYIYNLTGKRVDKVTHPNGEPCQLID